MQSLRYLVELYVVSGLRTSLVDSQMGDTLLRYSIHVFLILALSSRQPCLASSVSSPRPSEVDWQHLESAEYKKQLYEAFLKEKHKGTARASLCYGELGCFDTGGKFLQFPDRPLSLLPAPRDSINTEFLLFTRKNSNLEQKIKANDAHSITSSNYDSSRETKLIVHGFLDNGRIQWIKDMTAAFLVSGDYNVIAVNWGGGSGLPYTQATANTRIVGAEIALLVNYLKDKFGANPEKFHITGHSLGSHIAGYAGERISKLGRITGLDPAEPYFKNTDPIVRLDPSDALFVDVIHTDVISFYTGILTQLAGLGLKQPIGHLDYYPNGGKDQPGCGKMTSVVSGITDGLTTGVREFFACNHLRATKFFTDSILNVHHMVGVGCASYEQFVAGACMECTQENNCIAMGMPAAEKKLPPNVVMKSMFLKTDSDSPFALFQYQVKLMLSGSQSKDKTGSVYIRFHGNKASSEEIQLSDGGDLNVGHTHIYLVAARTDVGQVQSATLRWTCSSSVWNPFSWCTVTFATHEINVANIDVLPDRDAKRLSFCNGNDLAPMEAGTSREFCLQ